MKCHLFAKLILIFLVRGAKGAFPGNGKPTHCLSASQGALPWVPVQVDQVNSYVRCLSLDGKECIWLSDSGSCWATISQAYLTCGSHHASLFGGATGYEDSNSWCSLGRAAAGLGAEKKVGPPTRVTYGTDHGVIYSVPESGHNPDGTLSSILIGSRWALFWPNGKNWRSVGASPFFQDSAGAGFDMVYGWVPCERRDKWNTFYSSGFWLFLVTQRTFGAQGQRLIGLGHAETGTYGNGVCKGAGTGGNGATFKVLGVAHSDDEGRTWSDPEIIISTREFDRSVPTNTFSGAGDPGYTFTGSEFRAYFQLDGNLCFARSADSEARSGTWQVLMPDGSFRNAINFGGGCKSILPNWAVGPNPHVFWDTRFATWIMTVWPWGSRDVTFFWSNDGTNWTHFQTLQSFRQDGWHIDKPLYPSIVSRGGSQYFDGTGFIYYAHWTSGGAREMWYRTVSIE